MQGLSLGYFLAIAATVFSGVAIFLAGQRLLKFFLEPMQDFYKLKGEIADSLIYYANVYLQPGQRPQQMMQEAHDTLRQNASALLAKTQIIPFYSVWAFMGLLPCRQNVFKAHKNLNGLSGGVYGGGGASSDDNERRRTNIVQSLNLDIIES